MPNPTDRTIDRRTVIESTNYLTQKKLDVNAATWLPSSVGFNQRSLWRDPRTRKPRQSKRIAY